MTPDDVAAYLEVSQDRVTELRKRWPVVGTKGSVVPLYASDDVVTRCAEGHVLPPRRTRCKVCRFERLLASAAA